MYLFMYVFNTHMYVYFMVLARKIWSHKAPYGRQ